MADISKRVNGRWHTDPSPSRFELHHSRTVRSHTSSPCDACPLRLLVRFVLHTVLARRHAAAPPAIRSVIVVITYPEIASAIDVHRSYLVDRDGHRKRPYIASNQTIRYRVLQFCPLCEDRLFLDEYA